MPMYDYRCEANNRVVEVRHCMSESMSTWGELCAKARIDPGDTPADAPVERLIAEGVCCGGGHGHSHDHGHSHGGGGCCGGGSACGCG